MITWLRSALFMAWFLIATAILSLLFLPVLGIRAPAGPLRWKIPLGRMPAPSGVLSRLPGDGNQMALTVDDGVSVPVVGAFAGEHALLAVAGV